MRNDQKVRWLLWFGALVYAGIGCAFTLWPREMGAHVGIQLSGATAVADLRAVYGGLQWGIAVFLAVCGWERGLHRAGILLSCFCFGGLLGARLGSHFLEASYDKIHFLLGGSETLGLILSLVGLFLTQASRQTKCTTEKKSA